MPLYRMQYGEGEAKKERLVEANTITGARNWLAKELIQGEVAKPVDLFRLAKEGAEVEVATGAAEGEPEAE